MFVKLKDIFTNNLTFLGTIESAIIECDRLHLLLQMIDVQIERVGKKHNKAKAFEALKDDFKKAFYDQSSNKKVYEVVKNWKTKTLSGTDKTNFAIIKDLRWPSFFKKKSRSEEFVDNLETKVNVPIRTLKNSQ